MWNIDWTGFRPGGAEARFADPRPGQQLHPVAQQSETDSDIRADQAIATDLDTWPDHGVGANAAAATDTDTLAQDGARLDDDRVILGGLCDRDGALQPDGAMQQGRSPRPRGLGLARDDDGDAGRRQIDGRGRHDHAPRLGFRQGGGELAIAHKRNRAPVRTGQGRNGRDDDLAAPGHLPADLFGEGGDRQGRQGLKEPRIGHGPPYDCG
ncbi:hypothetical protein D3C80_1011600 [compost metagenome]